MDIGKARSNRGRTSKVIRPARRLATIKIATARPASLPARAASAVAVMPVINNATINGTIVILSALSQSRPMGSMKGRVAVPVAGDTISTAIPRSMPTTSAERMIHADFKFNSPGAGPGQLAKPKRVT